MKVLVTDSHTRTALYVIRSIASRGIDVTAHIEKRHDNLMSFGTKSRYVKIKIVTSTDPGSEEASYIKEISRIAESYDVIIPITTKTIMAIAKNRHLFKGVGCLIPEFDQINLAQNKSHLYRYSTKIGIPIPTTYFPESINDVKRLSEKVKYPVYIKLCEEGDYRPKERYNVAFNQCQLVTLYTRMHKRCPLPIIQEKINGAGLGFFALFDENSQPIACFGHRRIRQYPYRGGPSACCESYKDTRVISQGINLLTSLKWKGLAMVEFIEDNKDGVPKLLEVNPRFWGSTPLAIAAGIDFPYLLLQASLGQKIKTNLEFKEGVKVRFFVNDLMAVVDHIKYGKNKLDFLRQFIRDLADHTIRDGIVDYNDLKPSLAYLGILIQASR